MCGASLPQVFFQIGLSEENPPPELSNKPRGFTRVCGGDGRRKVRRVNSQRRGETIIESHLSVGGYVTVDVGGFDRISGFIA